MRYFLSGGRAWPGEMSGHPVNAAPRGVNAVPRGVDADADARKSAAALDALGRFREALEHIMSNMIMTCAFGVMTERVYGVRVVALVWTLSALGGNPWSAAVENRCGVLVGASGGVFGYFGIYCRDSLVRWKTLTQPMTRVVSIALMVGQFMLREPNVSHVTHAGGLMCGVACSVLPLPDIQHTLLRRCPPPLSGFIVIVSFVVMPSYAYGGSIDTSRCPPILARGLRRGGSAPSCSPSRASAPAPRPRESTQCRGAGAEPLLGVFMSRDTLDESGCRSGGEASEDDVV